MPDKDQILMFNKAELHLFKVTFAENDELLYAIRKVMHQFELSEDDKKVIKAHMSAPVLKLLRKRILPELSNEYPLGQLATLLASMGEAFKTKPEEEMDSQFEAKKLELDYIEQQLRVLEDLDAPQPIKLSDMADLTSKERYVNVTAYLYLLGYLDMVINFIKSIAGEKDETPEEQKKRITRDSSR